jgi:hypothetical protein
MIRHKLQCEVTEDDIKKGKRARCFVCPVALAITRELKKIDENYRAGVTHTDFTIFTGSNCINDFIQLPIEVSHAVMSFDDNQKIVPFNFEVEVQLP